MPQWFGFVIFFLIVTLVYVAAHFYIFSWFVRLAQPSRTVRRILLYLFIFLVASYPAGKILGWHNFNAINYGLNLVAAVWMGHAFYLFHFALGSDLLIIVAKAIGFGRMMSATNPFPYKRALAAGIAAGVLIIGGCALQEARSFRVTRLEIPLRGLPPELDGFSIAQVSDIHYGMLTRNQELSRIFTRVNDLQPDIVVITGDLVDESVSHMEEMRVPLSGIKSRHGVFAVTGNHEYYAGVDRAVAIMKGANIRVLRNEILTLPGGLQILGIDDPTGSRRMGQRVPDFDGLVSSLDQQKPSILLYHQPIMFEKTASCGIGLQLSGHTHGGQLFPVIYI